MTDQSDCKDQSYLIAKPMTIGLEAVDQGFFLLCNTELEKFKKHSTLRNYII